MKIEARPVQVIEAPEWTLDEWARVIVAGGALVGALVAASD